ncbi:MAG: metal ABC transporter substrate-binding protein [Acetivibrionales bacterium]|jgi:zinc transport system substrate-binding protein
MKKTVTILLSAILFLSFAGCGKISINTDPGQDKELLVVTSFYPMYIFTKNITNNVQGVKVVNMTEPQTGCLHDYQLVPADIKVLEKADIFVINGAGLESFLDKITSRLPGLMIIEAAKDIELLEDGNGEKNPHVWVSISGAIQEVKNITNQLTKADPENEQAYRKNSEEYVKRLENLKDSMHEALKDISIKDIVTFHEAFPYFAREFGLNIVSVVEREPGSESSAGELADTIKAINNAQVKVLFAEPQYSQKAAESISAQTGAEIYILDPVVTGPKEAAIDSYEKTMEENLKVLIEALK